MRMMTTTQDCPPIPPPHPKKQKNVNIGLCCEINIYASLLACHLFRHLWCDQSWSSLCLYRWLQTPGCQGSLCCSSVWARIPIRQSSWELYCQARSSRWNQSFSQKQAELCQTITNVGETNILIRFGQVFHHCMAFSLPYWQDFVEILKMR